MTAESPSLGTMIRSRRLGWGLSRKHGAFIRMSDGPDTPSGRTTVIELCPVNAVPSKKCPSGFHRVWWETPDILEMIPWLRGVTRIKRYVSVVINDEGEIQ
jgi:hypothetical protein